MLLWLSVLGSFANIIVPNRAFKDENMRFTLIAGLMILALISVAAAHKEKTHHRNTAKHVSP